MHNNFDNCAMKSENFIMDSILDIIVQHLRACYITMNTYEYI